MLARWVTALGYTAWVALILVLLFIFGGGCAAVRVTQPVAPCPCDSAVVGVSRGPLGGTADGTAR